jgi:OmpA-OmpF porin, OOP family
MTRTNRVLSPVVGLALAIGAAGCAARTNAALERARAEYRTAAQDPEITTNAPVALHEADQALAEADRAMDKGKDEKDVDTLAYVAEKRVEIARAAADQKRAESNTAELDANRDRVLVDARTADAEVAKAKARQLQAELDQMKAKETERGLVVTLSDVLFEFNRADIKPGAMRDLGKLVEFLQDNPTRNVLIEGHTDSIGSDSYNVQLSEQRARAVESYLLRSGVSPSRITARGYGETYPVAGNDSESGRQQNRRVEMVILKEGEVAASHMR